MLEAASTRWHRVRALALAFLAAAGLAWSTAGPLSAAEPGSGVSQSFTVIVPEHEVPPTTSTVPEPVPGDPGSPAEGGSGSGTTGLLPRTGLDARLALVAALLVSVGALLIVVERRLRRGPTVAR